MTGLGIVKKEQAHAETVSLKEFKLTRSHLKKRILVQDQGGAEFQTTGILKYVEDLKRGTNTEIGPKDFFEIASNLID